MTLFFNSSTASVLKESIITLTCVPVLLSFFAFTMLVLKNILQLLNKTHNLIVLLSAWLGEEHSDETFMRRVSKNSRSPLCSSCLNFSANKNYFSWNLLLTFIGWFNLKSVCNRSYTHEKCLTPFCYHTKNSHIQKWKSWVSIFTKVKCPLLNVKIQLFILEFFMWCPYYTILMQNAQALIKILLLFRMLIPSTGRITPRPTAYTAALQARLQTAV